LSVDISHVAFKVNQPETPDSQSKDWAKFIVVLTSRKHIYPTWWKYMHSQRVNSRHCTTSCICAGNTWTGCNYIFNVRTKCTLYNWPHIFYQMSPTCFCAYCTIIRDDFVSLAQNYLCSSI
jgi:hypothetical protein